jgi:hypothetical protein
MLKYNTTVVVQNKSSLLMSFIITNTQTLQPLTINIKTEIITKIIKTCQAPGLGSGYLES